MDLSLYLSLYTGIILNFIFIPFRLSARRATFSSTLNFTVLLPRVVILLYLSAICATTPSISLLDPYQIEHAVSSSSESPPL